MNTHKTQVLIDRARAGDRDSYDELFENAAAKLLLYVRLSLGGELRKAAESQDVVQETYLHAHRDFTDFESRKQGAFGSWLCAIARNRIRDLSDKQTALQRQPKGMHKRLSLILEHAMDSSLQGESPTDALSTREERKNIEQAVGALPEDLREVVLLRFFEGRTIDVVGRELGLPATTVRRRLGSALAKLGSALDGMSEVLA